MDAQSANMSVFSLTFNVYNTPFSPIAFHVIRAPSGMARRRTDAFFIKFESHGIAHEVRACVLHTFRHTEEKKRDRGGGAACPQSCDHSAQWGGSCQVK